MVEVNKGRRKFGTREERRSYWRDHIEQWRQSGQSKRAYCRAQELNPASFYRWQGKLDDAPKETPGFIPVRLTKGTARYPIEVTLAHFSILVTTYPY